MKLKGFIGMCMIIFGVLSYHNAYKYLWFLTIPIWFMIFIGAQLYSNETK